MKKTYTVTDILFSEIPSRLFQTKGTLEYFLVDAMGNERKVTTIATLGRGKSIKSIRPIYKRETPLVDALKDAEVDQIVCVDFAEFNQTNKRVSLLATATTHQGNTTGFSPSQNALPDFSRFPLLMSLIALGTLLVFMVSIFSR